MRLRIRSVRNIAQVTRALQTVSASKVRRAQAAVLATRPYAAKALEVLGHLAGRRNTIVHPMLTPRNPVRNILAIVVSGDRGLAGAYNANVVRRTLSRFADSPAAVHYIVIGRKGREMLRRAGVPITAEFSNLPPAPSYADLSAIGRLAIEDYVEGKADEVHIVFTQFVSLMHQQAAVQQLLPLSGLAEAGVSIRTRPDATAGYRDQPAGIDRDLRIDSRIAGQRTRGADGDNAQRHRKRQRADRRTAAGL
jgi:F-type H+-transporting ATPase subunit gamma